MKSKRIFACSIALLLALLFSSFNTPAAAASRSTANAINYDLAFSQTAGRAAYRAPRRRARTFDVEHYVIKTSFDAPSKTVFGEVDITLTPLSSSLRNIELDAANLKVSQVSLLGGKDLRFVMNSATMNVILDRTYGAAESLTVRIRYRAQPQRGLYFVSASSEFGYQRPAQIWSQGEPEDNHYWFPCYDFPDDKVTSEQYITTGVNQLAIANGTLLETTNNPNGSRTFHWQMSQPHSSYLISLVVGDYAKLNDSYKGVVLEYYTYPGTEQFARRAFNVTPAMMGFFSKALGVDFPYQRYAQTIVGNFIFGGMENVTATTFADNEILTGNVESDGPETVDLVSHELAHSWFGNLVTCKDWSHLWLNEGFATFLEATYIEHLYGREAYLVELQKDAVDYLQDDPARGRHPLVNPNYPLSMELFDITTYKKGGYVVHMLRETVGDEMFWKALNVYLNEYKYRTVDSRDLQRTFERVSGRSLEWFFDQWVYKGGYPELSVRSRFDPATGRFTIGVTQTQKADYITPAVFRLSLDVEIVSSGEARIERIEVSRRTQEFTFQLSERPSSVIFDKGGRVLKKVHFIRAQGSTSSPIVDGAETIKRQNFADMYVHSTFIKPTAMNMLKPMF